jgi:uncharacterized protein YozE (UPF0346 family)
MARTFIGWLRKQAKRKDPVGGLADFLKHDSCFPAKVTTPKGLKIYLNSVGADDPVLTAMEAAASEFKALEKK